MPSTIILSRYTRHGIELVGHTRRSVEVFDPGRIGTGIIGSELVGQTTSERGLERVERGGLVRCESGIDIVDQSLADFVPDNPCLHSPGCVRRYR